MSMEGTTRIELTDVRTGRTEVREHKNRVTGAVQEIFTPLGLYTSAEMLQPQDGEDANSPLAYAFGGLLLLDTAVGSSEDALLIPPGAQITGTAAHGAPNNGENRIRGSYNAAESSFDAETGLATFVYDFSTQQANGTIASVCLTHRSGAYLSSEDTHASADHCTYDLCEDFGGQLSGAFALFLDAQDDIPYLLELDEADDSLLLAKPAAQGDTLRLDLIRYPAFLRSLDLFWQRGANRPDPKSQTPVTLSAPLLKASNGTAYFLGWNYGPQDRTLYIVNAASNRLAANAAFQVYAVNAATQQQTLYTLTNQTGVELAGGSAGTLRSGALTQNLRAARPLEGYVYDGHVYLRSYAKTDGLYRYFKIALDDAGDVTEIDCAGLQLPYVNDACAGRLYCYAGGGIGGGAYGTVLDTARDRLRRIEVYSGEADWFKRFDIRGRTALQVHARDESSATDGLALSVRANYLATVNDLAEPVQKTADKTMKVTYILRRTAGA